MNDKYIFWTSDPTVLYKNQSYVNFIPSLDMTRVEQLNAITRFCVYFLLLSLILGKSELWIQIPILTIVFVIILYYTYEKTKSETYNDTHNKKLSPMEIDEIIETGFYDSDGNLYVGDYFGPNARKIDKNSHSFEEYAQYKKSSCRKPTVDNPFMNPTANDFELEDPPEACNADDEDIKDKITQCFNDKLFRDVGDLFEVENSQRQFYTVPHMNPPDQTAFAKWLYGSNTTCKTDQSKCLKYEDLRSKRDIPLQ